MADNIVPDNDNKLSKWSRRCKNTPEKGLRSKYKHRSQWFGAPFGEAGGEGWSQGLGSSPQSLQLHA